MEGSVPGLVLQKGYQEPEKISPMTAPNDIRSLSAVDDGLGDPSLMHPLLRYCGPPVYQLPVQLRTRSSN